MGIRSDILTNLETRVRTNATGVVTTSRILRAPYLPLYGQAALPAVFILDPEDETYDYQASKHALTSMSVDLHLYKLQWNEDKDGAADSNSIIDKVKDAIHKDISNGNLSVNTSVRGIRPTMRNYPLFGWAFHVQIDYYANYESSV